MLFEMRHKSEFWVILKIYATLWIQNMGEMWEYLQIVYKNFSLSDGGGPPPGFTGGGPPGQQVNCNSSGVVVVTNGTEMEQIVAQFCASNCIDNCTAEGSDMVWMLQGKTFF